MVLMELLDIMTTIINYIKTSAFIIFFVSTTLLGILLCDKVLCASDEYVLTEEETDLKLNCDSLKLSKDSFMCRNKKNVLFIYPKDMVKQVELKGSVIYPFNDLSIIDIENIEINRCDYILNNLRNNILLTGSEIAYLFTGELYEKGICVPKDTNQALYYYNKSGSKGAGNYLALEKKTSPKYIEFHINPIGDKDSVKCEYLDIFSQFAFCSRKDSIKIYEYTKLDSITVINKGQNFAISDLSKTKFEELAKAVNKITNTKRDYTGANKESIANELYRVGYEYYTGQGRDKDFIEAEKWLTEAAILHNTKAQFILGVLFQGGIGVVKDDEAAAHYFTQAAENGHVEAMRSLGVLLISGADGVQKDTENGLLYVQKAAEGGDKKAVELLEKLREEERKKLPQIQTRSLSRIQSSTGPGRSSQVGGSRHSWVDEERNARRNQENINAQRTTRCMEIVNTCYRRCLLDFGSGPEGSGSRQSRCNLDCAAQNRNCNGQSW